MESKKTPARTILILTSKTGGGHISLAEALRDRLIRDNKEYHIEILDPQSSFFHWHYRIVSRYALWLWSAEFQMIDTALRARVAHRVFTLLVTKALYQAMKRLRPDLIITTYPFLTYEVMQILKKYGRTIPFAMLFTDPKNVHATWLTEKDADATLAPTQETYQQALQDGFTKERLHQVGWPVRAQFMHNYAQNKNELMERMGLQPERFTLFLQGGGEGAAQFGNTVERMIEIDAELQIILAAGTNQLLQSRFAHRKNMYVLPFTKEIAPYMAAADVIMGKAGPNMLFEAVALGKPFIATAYIPGQEYANLGFIQEHQLGWVALQPEEQLRIVRLLINKNEILEDAKKKVATYQQWNEKHNECIVPILEKLLLKNRPMDG